MKKNIVYFIVLVAVVLLAIFLIGGKSRKEVYQSLVEEDNAVVILDQKGEEDDTVTVAYAKLSKPGYVVVSSKDGATGKSMVLGTSSLLPAGEHFNIKIKSSGVRSSGKKTTTVVASLVEDNGDGVFNSEEDMPLPVNEAGDSVESEAMVGEDVIEESSTIEDIADALEEENYSVNDDADVLEEMDSEDDSENPMEAETELESETEVSGDETNSNTETETATQTEVEEGM